MPFKSLLLILAACLLVATADDNIAGRYSLPPSEVYIVPCRQEALLRHQGVIEEQRILHRQTDFWVRHEIQSTDGLEWLVLCDLGTGKIIREQKLVNAEF